MKNKPELLAPVGGYKQLMAAIENGADAIYLGGEFFNARINAENFDSENMIRAIAYAHTRNVKVYVTINTLIYDDELENALNYVNDLYSMRVDAVIIQDMGLAKLINKNLPEMEMHLSTQGTVYNLSGVNMAAKLGFKRVVLARETSLEEIKYICNNSPIEIEVFIHGALCMCYSGQCQLSRNMGGRSGNRGLCAQPCRLAYESQEGTSYFLSPKDICTIDNIDKLWDAGVASLKIEGRMKSPEYVAIVTKAYRKYLDLYEIEGNFKVSDKDREELTQIFSRGDFSKGYLLENPKEKLLSGEMPKHQGLLVGEIIKKIKGSNLIEIKLYKGKNINLGDGIEIHNENLPGNLITYKKQTEYSTVIVGDIKGKVSRGDHVYKITDIELMEKARKTFDEGSWEAQKLLKKIDIEMNFQCKVGKNPILEIFERNSIGEVTEMVKVEGIKKTEKALNKPLTEDKVKEQLGKMGGVPFNLLKLNINMDNNISIPVSSLNELRRLGIEALIKRKAGGRVKKQITDKSIYREYKSESIEIPTLELYYHTVKSFSKEVAIDIVKNLKKEGITFSKYRIIFPVKEFYNMNEPFEMENEFEIMPYIPNISKGKIDIFIKENLEEIVEKCGKSGIYIGNLGWINEFMDSKVLIYGDYGLNINNNEASQWARELGFIDAVPSLEVFNGTNNSKWLYSGAVPLMTTEHPINKTIKETRKGITLEGIYNMDSEKSIIFEKSHVLDYKKINKESNRGNVNLRIFI